MLGKGENLLPLLSDEGTKARKGEVICPLAG